MTALLLFVIKVFVAIWVATKVFFIALAGVFTGRFLQTANARRSQKRASMAPACSGEEKAKATREQTYTVNEAAEFSDEREQPGDVFASPGQ